jgi:quercetin dioxygenase-like cupin family protein
MKPLSVVTAVLRLVLLLAPASAALGQAPIGPTNPFHSEFDVTNPPAQFDEIVLLGELAPGVTTPHHTSGGDQYLTVIAGQLTRRTFGATPAEKVYKAGDTLIERAGEVQELANAGTAPARWLATILVPQGAPLTTDQQSGATSQQLPEGLTAVYHARQTVAQPAAQFKVVQDELDFAPGAWVPPHTHGGPVFGLVLEGTFTDRQQSGEKQYNAGDSFTEPAHAAHAIGNAGTAPARFFGTILLPPGEEIITIQAPPPAPPQTMPRTSQNDGYAPLVWLIVIAGSGAIAAGWLIRRKGRRA